MDRHFTRINGVAALVAIFVLATAPGMLAQQKRGSQPTERSVQGTVSDAGGNAVSGAVVQLKNVKTLQIRSFITREQGDYYFHGLSPDIDYELTAESQSAASATKTLSSFDSRKEAVMNLKLDKKR